MQHVEPYWKGKYCFLSNNEDCKYQSKRCLYWTRPVWSKSQYWCLTPSVQEHVSIKTSTFSFDEVRALDAVQQRGKEALCQTLQERHTLLCLTTNGRKSWRCCDTMISTYFRLECYNPIFILFLALQSEEKQMKALSEATKQVPKASMNSRHSHFTIFR